MVCILGTQFFEVGMRCVVRTDHGIAGRRRQKLFLRH
jgi:hypothetical protein